MYRYILYQQKLITILEEKNLHKYEAQGKKF